MQVYDTELRRYVEEVDEVDVVFNLIKSSTQFKNFYYKARMEKLGKIIWRIDPEIDPMSKMRTMTKTDAGGLNCPTIYIRDINIHNDDIFIVAHEIMHCVLTEEGKSLIIFGTVSKFVNASKSRALASSLQTMLEDPVVDSILQSKCGFDAIKQYRTDLAAARKDFENTRAEPKEQLASLYMAFIISNNILKWRIVQDYNAVKEWHLFLDDFRRIYPNVSEISDAILAIIDEFGGLESIEQKKSIFSKISKKYNLEDILTIDPPSRT